MKTSDAKSNYTELNWLRGFAALSVVLFHYTVRYDQIFGHADKWKFNVPWGGTLVLAFFMMSGFFAFFSKENSAKEYFKKRFLKLYPVYWVCILCTVSVMKTTFPLYTQLPDSSISFPTVLLNFTMLQGFLLQPSVDGAYWTLAIELRFYFFYFLILLFHQKPKARYYLLMWIFISAALEVCSAYSLVGRKNGAIGVLLVLMMQIFVPEYSAVFTTGAFIALYSKSEKKIDLLGLALSGLLALACFNSRQRIVYMVTVVIILGCVLVRKSEKLQNRYIKIIHILDQKALHVLTFIASISYPLYLLHQHIGFSIIWNLEQFNCTSEWFIIVPITVCLGLAYAVQMVTDKFINLFRKDRIKCRRVA